MDIILVIKFIILGIVQGITEPLPISSSGHLLIVSELLNMDLKNFLTFAGFINFGSTLAIIIYFSRDIKRLFWGGIRYLKSGLKEKTSESRYLWRIFYSTLPLVFVTLYGIIKGVEFNDTVLGVGIALLFTAILLLLVSKLDGNLKVKNMTIFSAVVVGIGQAFALLPGISRSGTTMAVLLILGFRKKDAFKYSFIMFIPASFGALISAVYDIVTNGVESAGYLIMYIVCLFLSLIFTLVALKVLERMVINSKLKYFSLYCFVVSILIMFFYLVN